MWTGAIDAGGYGRINVEGQSAYAHRVSYELHVGAIPAGLTLDHLCRNTPCCNPAHLEPVTQGENTLRGESPWAKRKRQTHCVNGHEFTPENTYIRREGWRQCIACNRARRRAAS
jgi:hypothetical protein